MLKLKLGLTLNMVKNTTKLPFIVAAELRHGRDQFLCPVVGKFDPHLGQTMCKTSLASYKNKTLRIMQVGAPPDFWFTSKGSLEGINIRLMYVLADKLDFRAKVIVPRTFIDANKKV